jgi:hypothetical protein
MIGIVLAILLKDYDPYPPEKHYSWEEDDDIDQESGNEPPDRITRFNNNQQ